jgi:CheY-like chemotaxis protein
VEAEVTKPVRILDMPDDWRTEDRFGRDSDRWNDAPIRILVVDDEPCILQFLAAVFSSSDCRVEVALTGKLALELAGTQVFDVAFVDYFLEEMCGTEVARKLHETQPDMKIVLMSGYIVNDRQAEMELAGASAFLTKPFSDNTAHLIVSHVLPRVRLGLSRVANNADYS